LRRWFDLVMRNQEWLACILTTEQGKLLAEAIGEIAYAASYIEFYAEEAKRIKGETLQSHIKDGRIVVIRQPVGVVAVITPWNFPAAMSTALIRIRPELSKVAPRAIGVHQGTGLRRLARSGAEADLNWRPHDPWVDLTSWQSLSENAVRAGGQGRAGQTAKLGAARP
jgi:succinate-semialdehyde dehydrogenase/glutarate-semialdehyde dehydrogenase